MRIFWLLTLLGVVSGCEVGTNSEAVSQRRSAMMERTSSILDNTNEQIKGDIKDRIFRQRINGSSIPNSELKLAAPSASPGSYYMDSEGLAVISLHIFGSELALDDTEQQVVGTVDIRNSTPARLSSATQAYIQLLRQKFYPKCVTLVQSELALLDGDSAAPRKLVDTRIKLSADKINAFMTIAFRASPRPGTLHDGANEYAQAFTNILTTNPSESIQNVYAVMCLSIVTDPRVYLR